MTKTLWAIKSGRGVMMGEDGRPLFFDKKELATAWLSKNPTKARVVRCLVNITELE